MQIPAMEKLIQVVPKTMRETLVLRSFGFMKIPLLFFTSPSVVELDDSKCVVKIPLNRRTRNHLNSMYFGTLCVGADCAGGLIAMRLITAEKAKVSLIFKDFKAQFLKRPEGDVHFTSEDGEKIRALVKRAIASGERENETVRVVATVPSKLGNEPVALFELTLSLKKKS
jgi:acyl-coenzyme A thioesterase PaaI-like protein